MRPFVKAVGGIGLGLVLFLQSPSFAARIDINILDFAFSPSKSRIAVGDTVRWTNLDLAPHTSTSDNGIWNSGTLNQGQSYSRVFSSTGTFPYHCAIHTSMKDTIFVQPTGIENEGDLPGNFELLPNYPNPFNARTVISFVLPTAENAKLDIYDILGKHIETLFDGALEAGEHSFSWDAGDKPSGIFFYRLTAGDKTKTARMLMVK